MPVFVIVNSIEQCNAFVSGTWLVVVVDDDSFTRAQPPPVCTHPTAARPSSLHSLRAPRTYPPPPALYFVDPPLPRTNSFVIMGHAAVWNSHPKGYGKGSRACRVCGSRIGLIRKYSLDICRRCFRENANAIGFHKVRCGSGGEGGWGAFGKPYGAGGGQSPLQRVCAGVEGVAGRGLAGAGIMVVGVVRPLFRWAGPLPRWRRRGWARRRGGRAGWCANGLRVWVTGVVGRRSAADTQSWEALRVGCLSRLIDGGAAVVALAVCPGWRTHSTGEEARAGVCGVHGRGAVRSVLSLGLADGAWRWGALGSAAT